MEWAITLAGIAIAVALAAYASWKSGRPRKDSIRGTWVSWPLVTVLAGAAAFMGVVHAANLAGLHTGANQIGGNRIGGPPIP
jgi:hypothetical protein